LEERGVTLEQCRERIANTDSVAEIFSSETGNDIWSMAVLAGRLEDVVIQSAAANEPAILAKYTFNLAKAFNGFYRDHKIISEADPVRQAVLVVIADNARRALTAALATMGIDVPEKM
jgi:arginyl-tRNA synthetase